MFGTDVQQGLYIMNFVLLMFDATLLKNKRLRLLILQSKLNYISILLIYLVFQKMSNPLWAEKLSMKKMLSRFYP